MADEPQVRRGDEGEWVTYLQQLLEQAGHSPGPIDGIFGPLTERAVQEYQAANGLDADGIVGPLTWASLTGGGGGSGGGDGSDGGDGAEGGDGADGDVPAEFVQAGAPARLSDWTDEQKQAYFEGTGGEDLGGEAPEELEVAMIEGGDGEGSLA